MRGIIITARTDWFRSRRAGFRSVFKPVMPSLSSRCWLVPAQPWMGLPADAGPLDRHALDLGDLSMTDAGGPPWELGFWKPHALDALCDYFTEEFVGLYSFGNRTETRNVAKQLLAEPRCWVANAERLAQVAIFCSDQTCWELYANDQNLIERVRDHLFTQPGVMISEGTIDVRSDTLRALGLRR